MSYRFADLADSDCTRSLRPDRPFSRTSSTSAALELSQDRVHSHRRRSKALLRVSGAGRGLEFGHSVARACLR